MVNIPVNYVFPTYSLREVRLFCAITFTAAPYTYTYYTVPQGKILKIRQVIITAGNCGASTNNCGLFVRDAVGNEITGVSRNNGSVDYSDTIFDYDEKVILHAGDTISTYSIPALGLGAFQYYVFIGIEMDDPYLYPIPNTNTSNIM